MATDDFCCVLRQQRSIHSKISSTLTLQDFLIYFLSIFVLWFSIVFVISNCCYRISPAFQFIFHVLTSALVWNVPSQLTDLYYSQFFKKFQNKLSHPPPILIFHSLSLHHLAYVHTYRIPSIVFIIMLFISDNNIILGGQDLPYSFYILSEDWIFSAPALWFAQLFNYAHDLQIYFSSRMYEDISNFFFCHSGFNMQSPFYRGFQSLEARICLPRRDIRCDVRDVWVPSWSERFWRGKAPLRSLFKTPAVDRGAHSYSQ